MIASAFTTKDSMKIFQICYTCGMSNLITGPDQIKLVSILDEGIYDHTCEKGHRNICVAENLKFEILFEIGASAIVDGYYREAILSVASAREMFFEFYLEFIARNEDLAFEQFWKKVSKQSERQFGAFTWAYFLTHGQENPLDNNEMTELRNKVAHKGYIPNKDEALKFSEYVYDGVLSTLQLLNQNFPGQIESFIKQKIKLKKEQASNHLSESDIKAHSHKINTLINSLSQTDSPKKFSAAFSNFAFAYESMLKTFSNRS